MVSARRDRYRGRGRTRDAEQQRRPQQAAENVLRFGAVAFVRMSHQEPVDGLEDLVVRERSAGHPPRQQGQLQVLEGIEQCIRTAGTQLPAHMPLRRTSIWSAMPARRSSPMSSSVS